MPDPIPPVIPAGQSPANNPPSGDVPTVPPSVFDELSAKKGWKNPEDMAKSYTESEKELSRKNNARDKIKRQLETQGYTVDDDGNITQVEQRPPVYTPPGGQVPSYPSQGMPPEPVYDPYTGQQITDPMTLQLLKYPPGQREAIIFNAMTEQREKQQNSAYQNDSEVLIKPEAKGFEDDVRKVMMQKPLQVRADKKSWEEALLQVKGARYDQDMRNRSQQGVEDFINKESIQTPAGAPAGGGPGGGANLSAEQENTYRWYAQNRPGMFKDRKHFLQATQPNYGR